MAFEILYTAQTKARILKLAKAIEDRGIVPAPYLLVSSQGVAVEKKKPFVLLYDQEGHQKTFSSLPLLQEWHGRRIADRLQDFICGYAVAQNGVK